MYHISIYHKAQKMTVLAVESLLRNSMQKSMEMSFLSHAFLQRSDAYEEHGDVFFGMPFYILGVCPENRDESNGDSIIKL
jgi:hypothetical protein